MSRHSAAILLILSFVLAGQGAEPKPLPKGPPVDPVVEPLHAPPRFATVVQVRAEGGMIHFREPIVEMVPVTVREVIRKDGKNVEREVTRLRLILKNVSTRFDVTAGKTFNAAGAQVKPEDLWHQLEVGQTVLLSSDGKKVHSTYRHLLKRSTLIFVSPAFGEPESASSEKK